MDPYQFLSVVGVARARPDAVIGVVLDGLTPREAVGANLTVRTGAAAGRELLSLGGGDGVIVAAGGRRNMSIGFEDVAIGDAVLVDNRDFLAYANFTRHQNEDIPELDVFRVDGRPVFPQRARATGSPELYFVAPYEAAFDQKMIVVQNTHDAQCWPCATENLRRLFTARRGTDADLRVWFTEHAMHLPTGPRVPEGPRPVRSTRLVDYRGHVHQAVRDMIAWVEDGIEPPADTSYARSGRRRGRPARRRGRASGDPAGGRGNRQRGCTRRRAGRRHRRARGGRDTPPGGGTIVAVEWDFDGTGAFPVREAGIDGTRTEVRVEQKTAFDAPGVYFPCVRVTAHRDGDVSSPQRRLVNLARVRVVVSG